MVRAIGSRGIAARESFFDRPKVLKAMDKAIARVLPKLAMRVKVTAQRSMRYTTSMSAQARAMAAGTRKRLTAQKSSKPGEPPRAIKPHPWVRKHLYAVYERRRRTAVIGPERLGKSTMAQEKLEKGGRVRHRNKLRRVRRVGSGGEVRIGGRAGPTTKPAYDFRGQKRMVTYARIKTAGEAARANRLNEELYGPETISARIAPRPYMGPALVKITPEMPAAFADSVK